eukprot:SAG31_NODE_9672_length_1243_cov_1.501748_1_plen_117_part_10
MAIDAVRHRNKESARRLLRACVAALSNRFRVAHQIGRISNPISSPVLTQLTLARDCSTRTTVSRGRAKLSSRAACGGGSSCEAVRHGVEPPVALLLRRVRSLARPELHRGRNPRQRR